MSHKPIKKAEVQHLANLASLTIGEEKINEFQTSLTSIVGYISEVQQINLEGVRPTAQVTGKVNEFRQDEVKPSLSQSEAISQAQKTHQGYFVVPAILKS